MRRVRSACLAVLLAGGGPASAQHPFAPDSCGAEVGDLDGLRACRRLSEPDRAQRCAAQGAPKLTLPTGGRLIQGFGQPTQVGGPSKGIAYQGADPAVLTPSAGRVLFAGQFRSYGNIVIIDACAVDVMVAGLATVSVRPLDTVAGGQSIGATAASDSILYIEVRKGSRAIDPFGPLAD